MDLFESLGGLPVGEGGLGSVLCVINPMSLAANEPPVDIESFGGLDGVPWSTLGTAAES